MSRKNAFRRDALSAAKGPSAPSAGTALDASFINGVLERSRTAVDGVMCEQTAEATPPARDLGCFVRHTYVDGELRS